LVAKDECLVHPFITELIETSNLRIDLCVNRGVHGLFVFLDTMLSKFPFFSSIIHLLPIFFESAQTPISVKELLRARLISGYFQRSWIVNSCRDLIVPLITQVLESKSSSRACLIREHPVIHVRRGDYQNAPEHWGLLSIEYYLNIFRDPDKIYCFTDIKESSLPKSWMGKGIKFFSPEQTDELETFYLLSKSREIAIANSSFSWWAGYLAAAQGAKVFAPSPWFKNSQSWSEDIYANSFIKIPAHYDEKNSQ
jgi:hypothetical protein